MSRWLFKMSSCGSNGMETSAPLINAVISNALFHSVHLAHQSAAASSNNFTSCALSGRHAASVSDFVIKCIEVREFCDQKSIGSFGSLTLLHFRTCSCESQRLLVVEDFAKSLDDRTRCYKHKQFWPATLSYSLRLSPTCRQRLWSYNRMALYKYDYNNN